MNDFIKKGLEKKKGLIDISWAELGKEFGLSEEAARSKIKRFLRRKKTEFDPDPNNNSKYSYNETSDGATIQGVVKIKDDDPVRHNRRKILENFLAEHHVDMEVWEVKEFRIGASDVTISSMKSSTEEDTTYTNYNIRVILKPRLWVLNKDKFIKDLISDVKKSSITVPKINFKFSQENTKRNLFVPVIADAHVGRLSWGEETTEDYDISIAKNNYMNAFNGMIERCKEPIEKVLYLIGNDFYNSDHFFLYNKTTAGTPQENDSRWQKMFREGRQIAFDTIDYLSKNIAPVQVVIMPGNHDVHFTYFLGLVIEAKYCNNKNVTCNKIDVDVTPRGRKYHKYGQNMFMFAHGKNEKVSKIHNIMSTDEPEMWATCKYKYSFLGHTHHYERFITQDFHRLNEDYMGVEVIHMPSIAHRDQFEQDKCFIGSQKGAKSYICNYELGKIHTIHYNF